MKTVYFVRHGESEGNVGSVFQPDESPLTERGKEQARYVADRCARLPIEYMVASTMKRTQETATIISSHIHLSFSSSDLFRERRKPKELEDRSHHDVEAQKINAAWWKSLGGDGSRVSDGENFEDLRARAGKALEYLLERPESNLLVVTHGFFLRYLVARAIYSDELSPSQFEPLMRTLWMENTGITALRYGISKWAPWVLWSWNDHAHLG